MNEQKSYLETGIKIGAGLGSFIALRGLLRGTRMSINGMYRRAKKLGARRGGF
jgi:hypothetical protein